MKKSIHNTIKNRILKYKRGRILFPNYFKALGSPEAVRKAFLRLEKQGTLIRLSPGIYLYPKKDKNLGVLYPSVEDIAKAIAKRDKARIMPTGIHAMNMLGLSTQVPMKAVFLTDGARRNIKVGHRTISFITTNPKNLLAEGELSGLIIQALKTIGKDSVQKEVIDRIRLLLKKERKENIIHDARLSPAWITKILLTAVK